MWMSNVDAAKVAVELEDAEAVPHSGIVSPADSIGPVLCMYSSKASASMASLTKSTLLVVAGAVVSSVEVAPSAEGPSSPRALCKVTLTRQEVPMTRYSRRIRSHSPPDVIATDIGQHIAVNAHVVDEVVDEVVRHSTDNRNAVKDGVI